MADYARLLAADTGSACGHINVRGAAYFFNTCSFYLHHASCVEDVATADAPHFGLAPLSNRIYRASQLVVAFGPFDLIFTRVTKSTRDVSHPAIPGLAEHTSTAHRASRYVSSHDSDFSRLTRIRVCNGRNFRVFIHAMVIMVTKHHVGTIRPR